MEAFGQTVNELVGNSVLGRIILALIGIAIVAVISHILVRMLKHFMKRDNKSVPQSSIFVNILRVVVWGLGICFILDSCFNINMTAVIAALGVGGIAISLGFQDTLSNLIGGTQISLMHIVQPGDHIQVGTNKGVVQDVTWRHTSIKNSAGATIIIPNSVISKNAVVHLPPPETITVPFIVTLEADLNIIADEVSKRAYDTALEYAGVLKEPTVLFSEVSESGSNGTVSLTIDDATRTTEVTDAIARAIAPVVR